MATKAEEARLTELSNMVDRLYRRLETANQRIVVLSRLVEILEDAAKLTDEQRDKYRKQAIEEQ